MKKSVLGAASLLIIDGQGVQSTSDAWCRVINSLDSLLTAGIVWQKPGKIINVGQCPTWWPPCWIQVAPSAQCSEIWLMPTAGVRCSNAVKTQNPLKFAGCPKLANSSQPLWGRSSLYYEDRWRRYWCLTRFFSDYCLSCEEMARQSCAMVPRWRFFVCCIFSVPRAAHFRHAF